MRRREFISLVGGIPAVWPLAAHAQQTATPVIGFLHPGTAEPSARFVAALRQGLGEVGYVDGQNVSIEFRWAENHAERLSVLSADLVRRGVNVIVTPGNTRAALAAKAATTTIPIVFGIPDDPVKFGLVDSLAKPGGNATGINFFSVELVAKRLGLLRDMVPHASRVAVLVNPGDATNAETTTREVTAAAATLGLQIQFFSAGTSDEIDLALATIGRAQFEALFVAPGGFFNSRRVQLAMLAARSGIPATYAVRDYVEAGGLMSYGTSVSGMFRQVGVYAGRILKGEKPTDLPVLQPSKMELVINLATAKALGLSVPTSMQLLVDEMIE